MSGFYLLLAVVLFANLLIGLVRTWLGPTPADRLLSVQLLTTNACAILLLLAQVQAMPSLRDVALLFALLAASLSVAFVRLPPAVERSERPPDAD